MRGRLQEVPPGGPAGLVHGQPRRTVPALGGTVQGRGGLLVGRGAGQVHAAGRQLRPAVLQRPQPAGAQGGAGEEQGAAPARDSDAVRAGAAPGTPPAQRQGNEAAQRGIDRTAGDWRERGEGTGDIDQRERRCKNHPPRSTPCSTRLTTSTTARPRWLCSKRRSAWPTRTATSPWRSTCASSSSAPPPCAASATRPWSPSPGAWPSTTAGPTSTTSTSYSGSTSGSPTHSAGFRTSPARTSSTSSTTCRSANCTRVPV